MSKTTFSYQAQRVTYETDVPVSEVLTRLDKELNRANSAGVLQKLLNITRKEDLESAIHGQTDNGVRDFMFFGQIRHDGWLNAYFGKDTYQHISVYTLGNPLIAQTMIRHDTIAGFYVPPKIFVIGNPDGKGAKVIYDLPSSLIAAGKEGELKTAAEGLDAKLENLVKKITAKL
ncbi:TT1751-like protein [Neolentinus lepideus HHB14362 ss-1]|uniref:TT1751-like protein n=1 Tax=Neolentinus lepideus HHB14362 ss-1 TaxID=1314782 RepID=A0A165T5A8_9AGAM|nr:TT1751-like protein [Neolentinus lepideus HHB14362 ss-1]